MSKLIKHFLKYLRKIILRSQREKRLAKIIADQILLLKKDKKEINILDYGSGFEPLVIRNILEYLKNDFYKININCCDYYTENQLKELKIEFGEKISFYSIKQLRAIDVRYDISICADVLHHVGVNNSTEIEKIINFLKSNSDFILIKDHYEFSLISRQILRFMDFIGNYYNNVNIPKNYFTKNSYINLIKKLNLINYKEITDYYYYSKIFLFFSNPKLHFISILKK